MLWDHKILLVLGMVVFPLSAEESWILSADRAAYLWKEKKAILIDARDKNEYKKSHIEGAISLNWEDLSLPNLPFKGNLKDPQTLKEILGNLGISNNKIVLVYGDPIHGWGEDGRVAWSLRALGHFKTFLVDGGYPALRGQNLPISTKPPKNIKPESFIPSHTFHFTATKEFILNNLKNSNIVFIDTREEREFIGGTPYGERRGGHIPGAKHIYYKEFLKANGEVKKKEDIIQILNNHGIQREHTIISYCTGGVRSALVTAILQSLGFNAINYPGSMWEWSHLPEKEYPLARGYN